MSICATIGRRLSRSLISLLLILGFVGPAVAQEPHPSQVSRTGQLKAPEREPVTLAQSEPAPGSIQTVLELPASADAYLASNRPNDNFGAGDGLFLGYSSGGLDFGAERILLRFDVPGSIPPNAQINDARIRLFLDFTNPAGDPPMDTVLRRLASDWSESGVTWNSEPEWGGVRASLTVGSSRGWYEWEVTSLVSGWLKGNYPNYGVEIIGDERVRLRERAFFARKSSTIFYPRLQVDYTLGPVDDEPPEVEVEPLPPFTASRDFIVSWSGSDQGQDVSGIDYYDVQVRVDDGDWVTWLAEVTFTEALFSGAENGRRYQFRARGVDEAGNEEAFDGAEAETIIDFSPPSTTVLALPLVTKTASFVVRWQGVDGANEAGIYCYDVQYRDATGPWTLWQQCTPDTSAIFTSMGDGRYQFEARAVDNLGTLEPFDNQSESTTIVDLEPPFVEIQELWLPILLNNQQ